MKQLVFCFFFILIKGALLAQQAPAFFPSNSLMPVGAYYYPEHWPSNQWERDLKKMAELGFTFTHFGEFAWANMEHEEGNYQFGWLDESLRLAQQASLKVILCTPSPTPPAWLTEKHPEILSVDDQGITQLHGSRLHVSYNHPAYLHYVEKIVTQLAKRYANHPAVIGWQLDNEPHYGKLYEYNPHHEKQFRVWLRQKYGAIDSLNRAWGAAFWSQSYNHFDQIHLPNAKQAPQGVNPHALLDFQRFNAAELAAALRFQAEVLRRYVPKNQFVTTNYAYFKFLPSVNPFLNRPDLDFASHTMYLTSGFLSNHGSPLAHRLGSGLELSFSADMARSVNGSTGIMELQPGQINWGVFNPQPLPGAVRMWVWHTFGLGDAFACTYRFRQPLFGSEQTHSGIMLPDGVTVQRGGQEYVQSIQEINALGKEKSTAKPPKSWASRKVAFLWGQDNLLDLENHRHHADFDPWKLIYTYYGSLKRAGAQVTFVTEDQPLDPGQFPYLVAPAYQMVSPALAKKWAEYVRQGGHLVLTSRTGAKAPNGHLWEGPLQQPIVSLIGAKVAYFDHLPAQYPGTVKVGDQSHKWHIWGDVLEPLPGTEVLGTHTDQFYAGKAAITRREVGKGSVTYVGIFSDTGEMEYQVLRAVMQKGGASLLDLPAYVFTEWRDGYWVTVNYTSEAVAAPVPEGKALIYGEKMVQPGGVAVWRD